MNLLTKICTPLLLATSALAQLPTPGSALVFPSIRAVPGTWSLVTVTNTADTPTTGDTLAYFAYVRALQDPNDPFHPLQCEHFCRPEYLTATDTVTVRAGCHSPFDYTAGYLVVYAVSPTTGQRESHNHLIGSVAVVDFISGAYYTYTAASFCSPQADGAALPGGTVMFDDVMYEKMHCELYADGFLAASNPRLALASFHGQPDNATINTSFAIWNDNEIPLSYHFDFECWFEVEVSNITGVFTQGFLAGVSNDPGETDITCDGTGDLESVWFKVYANNATLPGGTILVNNPPLMGVLMGGPLSCPDTRLLWGSKERCTGKFH